MRKKKEAEAIVTTSLKPKNTKNSNARYPKTTEGTTLSDFYREVHAAESQSLKYPYKNKNATEIELMMTDNRRLIEAARSKRI